MNEIQKALSQIQSKLKVAKDLKNNFGNYKYRNCEMILQEVKPLLAENECILTLNDEIVAVGNRIYIKATATLSKGSESISVSAYAREAENKKGMDDAQLTGSCSSYARKYALGGLFLLDDSKDIDSLDNSQEWQTKHIQHNQANIATAKLQKAKDALYKELLSSGLDKAEVKPFINWSGVDVLSIKAINDLLSVDLMSIISQFRESRGGEI